MEPPYRPIMPNSANHAITTLRLLVWQWLKHFILPPLTSTHLLLSPSPEGNPESRPDAPNFSEWQLLQIMGLPFEFPFIRVRMSQLFRWIQPLYNQSYTNEIRNHFWVHLEFRESQQVSDPSVWTLYSVHHRDITTLLGQVIIPREAYFANRHNIDALLILLSMTSSVITEKNVQITE
ncbi:hypothetical protein VKT23_015293 [Stygiomarasmius scandens]|uniref:Uncharacterized protein n=1 Tax=Marasmiellus scandens TaxID=2682957 RepID=A0ABR1IXY5_9AGAR